MLNFIIYEDNLEMRTLYERVILEFVGRRRDCYRIIPISKFDGDTERILGSLDGRKIYILDIEVPGKNGLDFAREIRVKGDWFSQIIIVSAFEDFRVDIFYGKMLTLDFISKKKDNVEKRLLETLNVAYHISSTRQFFSFQQNGELFHLPYHDILYFVKDINDNYTSIITSRDTYRIKKSISEIEKIVGNDLCFLKTHQSCIINLDNVQSVDLSKSTINFGGKETNLLSREHKKELKERLIHE